MQKVIDVLMKLVPMLRNGKTYILSAIGVILGILATTGVLTPDLHQQANQFTGTLLDQFVTMAQTALDFLTALAGVITTMGSLIAIFMRRGVAKTDKKIEEVKSNGDASNA